jgi:hypothetical protein
VTDTQAFALLVLSCAAGVTAHVALVFRLAGVVSRWLAVAALLVPPLALVLGVRARLYATSALWLGTWGVYFAMRARA